MSACAAISGRASPARSTSISSRSARSGELAGERMFGVAAAGRVLPDRASLRGGGSLTCAPHPTPRASRRRRRPRICGLSRPASLDALADPRGDHALDEAGWPCVPAGAAEAGGRAGAGRHARGGADYALHRARVASARAIRARSPFPAARSTRTTSPRDTALREAEEEIGLDPRLVRAGRLSRQPICLGHGLSSSSRSSALVGRRLTPDAQPARGRRTPSRCRWLPHGSGKPPDPRPRVEGPACGATMRCPSAIATSGA